MLNFANVYISPRVRASLHKVVQPQQHKKFWELLAKLKDGRFDIPGLNVEKLYSKTGKLFSARMSREMRLIFSMRKDGTSHSLIIHELNHHDQAYDSLDRNPQLTSANLSDASELLSQNLEPEGISAKLSQELETGIESEESSVSAMLFRVPYYLLSDPEKYLQFEKSLDRYLRLSEEQEEILSMKEKAFLVQGPAGTGKTTLALFAALNTYEENNEDAIYLFTYHDELACVCRAYKVNLLGEQDNAESDAGIKVFSYIDFCRRHLRQSLKKKHKDSKWISKQESIETLRQILAQKSRWSRHFVAEDLWGLIYSILKGRFMPGTEKLPAKREDYERIFRDYGRMPEAFDETLEIFAQYQAKLEKSAWLDEADLIRLSYESLKRNALLASAERRLWIVIDEVQDFTELEWKSILLFWENHCKQLKSGPSYPFLSGDTNQNISRSGFRWQELESYLQSILKNLHRPNSLRKVALHQNYRNTVQIHNLAAFVRKFGSDTSDLGLAPEHSGELPRLIIAGDDDLLAFLKEKDQNNDSSNPVVVLVEDEKSLSYLRRELSSCHSIFLLPLRNSKGMEFEDVIIHRAFSSARNAAQQAESARLFDLWYMGITRARKNLLLIQSEEDRNELKTLLAERNVDFFALLTEEEQKIGFAKFWANRELETPNYNVIFLERKLAQDLFDEYLKEKETINPSDNWQVSSFAEKCCQRALQLWKRCLDFSSLGKALMKMEQYEEAIPYLQRAGHREEAANCFEAIEQYGQAASEYETLQMLEDAARCYEHSQDFLKAGELYEKIESWQLAAQCYHSAGNLNKALHACKKAGMLRSAAEIYQIKGNYQAAAELYKEVEDYLNAGEMYLRIKDKLDAARCFQKARKFEKAIELYEGLNRWSEAGLAAKEAGLYARAAKLFLKAGNLPESASSYEAANLPERAADLFAKLRDFENAAQAYQKCGKLEAAALMYEQGADWQKALELAVSGGFSLLEARCRDKLGEYVTAAKIYLDCNAISEAAYCLEKANDYTQAADLHLKCENLAQAAACLAKIERRLDAAKLYVVSGQVSSAYELIAHGKQAKAKGKDERSFKDLLDWCVESKRLAAAGQLLEMKKEYLAAAEKFKECLMFNNAAQCLEKSGQFKEAALLFRESGEMKKAADCFKQAKLWQDAGDCFEQMKNWAEAKNMYELCKNEDGIARCANALNWF